MVETRASKSEARRRLTRFSMLAGKYQRIGRKPYTVSFVPLVQADSAFYRIWLYVMAYAALGLTILFCAVLFQPAHWIVLQDPNSPTHIANWLMLICLALLQLFTIVGTLSATRSSLKARDPVPVSPPKHLRVAFVTTRAPGEPIEMVRKTLTAATKVVYKEGRVDAWLLDETNDEAVQAICRELNVGYFSRAGIDVWNTMPPKRRRPTAVFRTNKPVALPDPFFAAKSKHGNYNAWRNYLKLVDIKYDILAGVDTDQVPVPNYLQRLLGYFRDQDVAYVVGPQVYGNYAPGQAGLVARWAESQASFFQSTIQRAGNASQSAMFVGTNYAVRMDVLDQIGGFQACITEDMATGLAIHSQRNPITGARWKSVYTPDVLAIGEGPDFWGPYFTQQWRWAAGTFDTWRRMVFKVFWKLAPKARLHYFLMLTFYPMAALTWLLAVASSLIYLASGATAVQAPWGQFIALYMMSLVMQLSLYFWNRRFNVSPHEPEGSYGIAGMVISSLTAPIYLSALVGVTLGKKAHFVVTTKGSSQNPDWWRTFRSHLQWAALLLAGLVYGISQQREHPAMILWVGLLLVICLLPVYLGMRMAIPARREQRNQQPAPEVQHA